LDEIISIFVRINEQLLVIFPFVNYCDKNIRQICASRKRKFFASDFGGQPGRPDWLNFRPMGDCLFWVVFLKIAKNIQILGLYVPRLRLRIIFDKKYIGQHFGRFFRKPIWSP
jgi:hypothetical protein